MRFAALCLGLCSFGSAIAAEPPYPPSKVITGIHWDFSQTAPQRVARGSDIWPLTWGVDGELYTAWGDGGGFTGSDSRGRVSIGFGKISGVPSDESEPTFIGHNIWGVAPDYAETQAVFGGKIQSMFSAGGVLYAYGGISTHADCKCPDPTKLEGDGPKEGRRLAWSKDLGRTWKVSRWKSSDNVYFLNFGRNNWEARDQYVYEYFLRRNDPSHIYLRRVRPARLTSAPARSREYLAGVDAGAEHVHWSRHEKDATAIFFDPANVSLPQVTYDAAIGRFLLTVGHNPGGTHATLSAGQLGVFESAHPWGPWATVDYRDDWGSFDATATGAFLGLHMPSKWMSADGKTVWAVFSNLRELDSFNLVKATLDVSSDVPRLTAPTADSILALGMSYAATAEGADLEWTVEMRGKRTSIMDRGHGSSFEIHMPRKAKASDVVRVTLKSPTASVYRDFEIKSQEQQR
jgi:hypothetical protein